MNPSLQPDPINTIREALENAKAEIVSRVDPNTETSMTLDDIDEALALLSPAPTCAAIVPPGNGYGPITSCALGDKFIGRITEAEAVELVNAVINSQLGISSGLQTMASGTEPTDLPALKKRCYAHFFDCEPSKVDEENDGDYIHVINQIVDFLAPLLGTDRAGGELAEIKGWLKERANPKCEFCDGTGIFYGNVRICQCVNSRLSTADYIAARKAAPSPQGDARAHAADPSIVRVQAADELALSVSRFISSSVRHRTGWLNKMNRQLQNYRRISTATGGGQKGETPCSD